MEQMATEVKYSKYCKNLVTEITVDRSQKERSFPEQHTSFHWNEVTNKTISYTAKKSTSFL